MMICEQHRLREASQSNDKCIYCQNLQYRKLLWVIARNYEGLQMYVSNKDLASIPDGAELLSWNEPLFDSVILKAISTPIDQPDLSERVHDATDSNR